MSDTNGTTASVFTTSLAPLEMDYTNRDYESIRTFLVSAARGYMPEWTTVGEPADFGTLLLELYAYMGDVMNYYIDRVAAEPFLATAARRQSILGIADMLGYVPLVQMPAAGTVVFWLETDSYAEENLTIPNGTVVQTEASEISGAIYFETVGHTFLGKDIRSSTAMIQEGRTVPYEYLAVSNAAPMQDYVLMNQGVIRGSMQLQVAEVNEGTVMWSYVDNLVDSDPDAAVFTTYLDDQLFTHVVFGDNVAGRIPPNGATLTISYRYGQGSRGNVTAGTITIITPPITDVNVRNDFPTFNGADNETIESMRYSIPRAARVRERAVTVQDFADLALQVPGVAKARAEGQYYTQIKVWIAPVGGGYPSDDLRAQVEAYLLARSMVGVSVVIHPLNTTEALYQQVYIQMDLYVSSRFGSQTVTNAVKAALMALFPFDTMSFGQRVTQGDVYHACLGIQGVDYIVLKGLQFLDQGVTDWPTAPTTGDLVANANQIPVLSAANLNLTSHGGLT